MPPITGAGFSLSDYAAQNASDPTTDFVQPGESRMSDLAERLGVDLNSLLKANPQIANPDQLTPGQEINLSPAPPPLPLRDAETTGESQGRRNPPNPSLPKQPLGVSAEASAMQAKIGQLFQNVMENAKQVSFPTGSAQQAIGEEATQTSIPDTDSPEWRQQQAGIEAQEQLERQIWENPALKQMSHDLDENTTQTSIPDTDSPEWQQQQAGIFDFAAGEAAKNEALAAKQRLNDLGLPPDPPKITSQDLGNRGPQGIPADDKAAENADERSRELSTEGAIDLYKDVGMHFAEKGISWAVKKGSEMAEAAGESDAASFMGKIGGAGEAGLTGLSIGGVLSLVANGILDWIQDGRDATNARENAMTEMHGGAINLAKQLVQEKFPQVRPLNERGIGQLKEAIGQWKQGIDGSLNDTLKDMQNDIEDTKVAYDRAAPGASNFVDEDTIKPIIDEAMSKLGPVLRKGTVDLANAMMAVEYDPRNWDESQSVGVSTK
jgi:LysM domain